MFDIDKKEIKKTYLQLSLHSLSKGVQTTGQDSTSRERTSGKVIRVEEANSLEKEQR